MKIYNKYIQHLLALSVLLLFLTVFDQSAAAKGQCTPAGYDLTTKKVYRDKYISMQGLADMDSDGDLDIFGYEFPSNPIVILNDGNGNFGEPVISKGNLIVDHDSGIINSKYYGSVNAGKLNSDGNLDLLIKTNTVPQTLHSFINNGRNGFTAQGSTTLINRERVHQVVDLNNDGIGDIVTVVVPATLGLEFAKVQVLYYRIGNANGTFGTAIELTSSTESIAPIVGDFNDDNKVDIAYVYFVNANGGSLYLKVLQNQGNAVFSESLPLRVFNNITDAIDLDGDNDLDLVGDFDRFYINDGSGSFTENQFPTAPVPNFPTSFVNRDVRTYSADIEGDGDIDVIFKDELRDSFYEIRREYYSYYINDGSGNFTKTNFDIPFNGIPANIDADAAFEQVNLVGTNSGYYGFQASASNRPIVIIKDPVCIKSPPGPAKLLDFTGDGISDLVGWNPQNGNWTYKSNVRSGSFDWGLGSLGDIPAPGDFDGDGKTDPSIYRDSTGYWYIFESSSQTWYAIKFGLPGDIPVPGDYTGNGNADIAVFRPSDGNWYILDLTDYGFTAFHFGTEGDKPVPQDYDGDGKIDVAVYRPSTGIWYFLRSTDFSYGIYLWGLEDDIPVPADFDSDGKADLAVFRPSNLTWYVLGSYDFLPFYSHYGYGQGTPMAVDSNGDGLMEFGQYTTHNGVWFTTGQRFGSWGSDPVVSPIRMFQPN